MNTYRRPIVALITSVVLIAVQAALDPTGLLALVGWNGAVPQTGRGLWPFAPYVVFIPVMLAMVWWVASRAGNRFWTLTVGNVLAIMLAQSAACLAMTGDLANSAWASAYVTAKAIPAALIIAAVSYLFGGLVRKERNPTGVVFVPAVVFAAVAPLVAGQWWTSVAYAPGVPIAQPSSGLVSVLIATLALAGIAFVCIRWFRARVRGILGGWLGAVVAGGVLGVLQASASAIVDGMPSDDIWPALAVYFGLADGLSYGVALGWLAGVVGVLGDRIVVWRANEAMFARVGAAGTATAAVAALVVAIVGSPPQAHAVETTSPIAPTGFLTNAGDHITDGEGNQVILRGVNVNQLVDFFAPRPEVPVTTPLTEQDFADMAAYGFNVVRLGMSWSALEPEKDHIDEAYLKQITDAVAWAKANDIYVVLDMHQDSWWNEGTPEGHVCRPGTDTMWGYDGAPTWATITDGGPRCQFQSRDISPASNRAFQNFYFNTDGVQTQFIEVWTLLAETFKDETAIAGFDLLNEPGFGETAPVTTSLQLGRFYGDAISAIRGAGAQQIVFIEPSILWSGLGVDSGPTPSFTNDRNIVFSPHLYSESITIDAGLGIPPLVGLERQFALAERAANVYGTPVWSGEYGYWGDQERREQMLTRYAALEDEYALGGAYWVWKQACGDPQNGIQDIGDGLMVQDCATGDFSGPNTGLLNILSRAYPQSAPGEITALSAEGASFDLSGSTPERACGLQVWIPGAAEPEPQAIGITNAALTAVAGGWLFTGCAEGEYALSN